MHSLHVRAVQKFMKLAGQELPKKPCVPDASVRVLRAKLILEEALETIKALGVAVYVAHHPPLEIDWCGFAVRNKVTDELLPCDLEKVADGCADITVVTTGTALACGIDPIGVQRLVDAANLAKFGEGGYAREDGKWMKPPNWQPPNIAAELHRQALNQDEG